MKRIGLTTSLALLIFISLRSQDYSKSDIDKMSYFIAQTIEENYVLPERGREIAKYFLKDLNKGRFYGLENLKKLDSTMCKSLREISKDAHLYVWNNLELVNQLKNKNNQENEILEDEDTNEDVPNFFNNEKARKSNYGFNKVEILPENIGYIKLNQINISDKSLKKVYATMSLIEDTDNLIIDLRDNPGGGSTLGSVLESYFFDKHTELLEFRKKSGAIEKSETVEWILNKRYLNPVYILINKGTGSAAEAFAFSLQGQNRATIVGESSSGGAYMNDYFLVNNQFILAVSTSAPFLVGTNISWEGDGVQPEVKVESEKALDKAIDIINLK